MLSNGTQVRSGESGEGVWAINRPLIPYRHPPARTAVVILPSFLVRLVQIIFCCEWPMPSHIHFRLTLPSLRLARVTEVTSDKILGTVAEVSADCQTASRHLWGDCNRSRGQRILRLIGSIEYLSSLGLRPRNAS